MNKVILIGNLGADPEVRYTQSGSAVANFNLATSERWKDKSGNVNESTEWHRIVVWNKLAETVGEYLGKGSKIMVEGKIQTKKWQDQNGNDRYQTDIVASTIEFIEPKRSSQGDNSGGSRGSGSGGYQEPPYGSHPPIGDDVPF